jgi:hypothetical protein
MAEEYWVRLLSAWFLALCRDVSVLVIADSLAWHGPERGELMTDPRLWPNLVAAKIGTPVEVVGRQGFTARDAWAALTKDPRVYSYLLPAAEVVLLAVGPMDQLPVAIPTYIRDGMARLPTARLQELAKKAYYVVNPAIVRRTGGPFRVLPQRQTDAYLTLCVSALRQLKPELPVLSVIPQDWVSSYYPSNRPHAAAAAAARAWGMKNDVPMIDYERIVAPFVPHSINPDGMHWGWDVHVAIADATAEALARVRR